jgi:integrase
MYSGLRRGELIHMTKDWIARGKIQVPSRIVCDCWECKGERWSRKTKKSTEKRLVKPSGFWIPKTENSARGIPLNSLSRELFDRFFKKHEAVREVIPCTRSLYFTLKTIEDRIKDRLVHELIPHGLRGIYAIRLAEKGIDAFKLQMIMGWDDVKTALWYVATYGPAKVAEDLDESDFVVDF